MSSLFRNFPLRIRLLDCGVLVPSASECVLCFSQIISRSHSQQTSAHSETWKNESKQNPLGHPVDLLTFLQTATNCAVSPSRAASAGQRRDLIIYDDADSSAAQHFGGKRVRLGASWKSKVSDNVTSFQQFRVRQTL